MSDFTTTARRGTDSTVTRRQEQEKARPKPTAKAEGKLSWKNAKE